MSQYEYKQLDDRHPDSPTCNSFQGEHIDVGPYVPASIAREIELKKAELERENARLRAALYVIGYNTEPPCLDHAADIAQTTLTQSADYSSFRPLPNVV